MQISIYIVLIGLSFLTLGGCQNQSPKIFKEDVIVSCDKPKPTCSKIGRITVFSEQPNPRTWTTHCIKCNKSKRLLKDKAITRGANYVWLQPSNVANQMIGEAYWCPDNCG